MVKNKEKEKGAKIPILSHKIPANSHLINCANVQISHQDLLR